MQREALALLADGHVQPWGTYEITQWVYRDENQHQDKHWRWPRPTPAQRTSVRRAMLGLEREGLVERYEDDEDPWPPAWVIVES